MPPLYFPHVDHLSVTPSPCFCVSHHRTVTLALFLSLLPAWLKVRGGKWFQASAVPHLQINSVSPPVKYAHWGKPKPSNLHITFNVEGEIYIKSSGADSSHFSTWKENLKFQMHGGEPGGGSHHALL